VPTPDWCNAAPMFIKSPHLASASGFAGTLHPSVLAALRLML
jgi:hypothetical protein